MRSLRFLALLAPFALMVACGDDAGVPPKDAALATVDAGKTIDAPVPSVDGLGATDAGAKDVPQVDVAGPDALVIDAAVKDAAAVDAPVVDAPVSADAAILLARVNALFTQYCVSCHNGVGATARLLDLTNKPDASTPLLARLLGSVPFETFCGASDAGVDASAWAAVVPGAPDKSLLYLKVTGTQPSPGTPPANCGVRMPRISVPGVGDAGATTVACDKATGGESANCVSPEEVEILRQWIEQGARP